MSQDEQGGERGIGTYRGVVMVVIGIAVLIIAANRADDYSWQGYLLAGACFAYGAFSLFWASRAQRRVVRKWPEA